MGDMVLAGDVGGTKTHLGLFKRVGSDLTPDREQIYATEDFHGLEEVVTDFISDTGRVGAACFGVPGPVINRVSHAVNIPWTIEEDALKHTLRGASVRIMNDLEATAYGVLHLTATETELLQEGIVLGKLTNKALVAAGTGLGEAGLIPTGVGLYAVPSEGGHCDFAPRNHEQERLLRFLAQEFGHVSFERVLSGPGLVNIHKFLSVKNGKDTIKRDEEHAVSAKHLTSKADPAAEIGELALKGTDSRCVHALEMFVDIYGAEAANVALKFFAIGGVYLAGGIAPKILPFLRRNNAFVRAFCDKGRLRSTLEKIPIYVCLRPSVALTGAAHFALSML